MEMKKIDDRKNTLRYFLKLCSQVPVAGWLLGILLSVCLEYFLGDSLIWLFGLPKIPVLFGFLIILKDPLLIPGTLMYVLTIYLVPVFLFSIASRRMSNSIAAALEKRPSYISVILHLVLLYSVLQIWSGVNDYRLLVLKMTMIAVIVTLSINVINGYMGEFSCSHPGFMAVGAYVSSSLSILLFADDRLFGTALLPEALGPFLFPLIIIAGGLVASISALIVAVPSFRTRGDYLAIISLAFMFIVKSVIENLEVVGGPRGLGGQPDYSSLPVVFGWTAICIWIINNFVRSIMGKALNAVRDNEPAADAMTVSTRLTKTTAFMFGAFWAGVAGGLFAHLLRYVNPGTFGLQKLAEILAMVYFGGLNSIYGSIVGAVSISMLGEALRPLEIYKWIVIPVLLILVMIYRPTGLISFKELDVRALLRSKRRG
jgi:branched-chain amino acid transport system permease protein